MSNRQINIVRATYSKVGPTSVSDSSLARTKKIQVRLHVNVFGNQNYV